MASKKNQSTALEVAAAIEKAMALAGRNLHDAAWEVLRNAEELANRVGIASGHLWWGLGAMADERGDAPNAVKYVMMALRHDPAAPAFLHSYGIVRERLLTTFKEMDATDPAVPTFFRLIADLDAVSAAVLIKLSRHVEAAEGNHQAALGLAQDAVDREPQNAEALRHLASLLAKAGRHQEARARRSEAEALAVTFSCPAAQA